MPVMTVDLKNTQTNEMGALTIHKVKNTTSCN